MPSAANVIKDVVTSPEEKTSPGEILNFIKKSRKGLTYPYYHKIFLEKDFFLLTDWANILNVSLRTLERYKERKQKLDVPQSERILAIAHLLKRGIEVFGNRDHFREWLNTESIALGKNKPKELLDTSFGIGLVEDELTRIEHGIFS